MVSNGSYESLEIPELPVHGCGDTWRFEWKKKTVVNGSLRYDILIFMPSGCVIVCELVQMAHRNIDDKHENQFFPHVCKTAATLFCCFYASMFFMSISIRATGVPSTS